MDKFEQTAATNASAEIKVLEYPPCADAPPLNEWNGWVEVGESERTQERSKDVQRSTPHPASAEQLAEEKRRLFEAGRERGRQEGQKAEREAQTAHVAAEEERRQRQLALLVGRIAEERDRFLDAVEQEVVRLALAIAARILRREAQMDPLLLTGAVRVALGQLAGSSEVRLCVPVAEADLWAETVASIPNLNTKPIVAAGDGMQLGDCMIESKVGTVDLGVRSQLAEIERGFFDRLDDLSPLEMVARSPGAQAREDADLKKEQP